MEGDGSVISTTLHFTTAGGLPAADSAFATANGCMQVHSALRRAQTPQVACGSHPFPHKCVMATNPLLVLSLLVSVSMMAPTPVQFANGERCALELAWEAEGGSIFCFGGGRGTQHHPAAPFPRTITVGCAVREVKDLKTWRRLSRM